MRLKLSLLTILFSMVSIMAIGQVIEEPAPPPPPPPRQAPSEEIFMVVEVMPEYPGCETVNDKEERKQCAQEALLAYVYSNLVYPPKAKENGQEGMAVVAFIVAKDGTLEDIKVMRDPGAGMGEAAAAVIHKMNAENIRWHPGTQRGVAVPVRFNLPVHFKLDKVEIATPEVEVEAIEEEMEIMVEEVPPPVPVRSAKPGLAKAAVTEEQLDQSWTPDIKNEVEIEEVPTQPVVAADKNYPPPPPPPPPPARKDGVDEIFKVVEEMPHYLEADCEEMATKTEKQDCAKEALLSFIQNNIAYPSFAKANGIEGTVVVTFVVEKDSSLSDIRLVRDIGAGCGQEAIRLVEQMDAEGLWIAGKQRGRTVRVQYNLPIKFRLDN